MKQSRVSAPRKTFRITPIASNAVAAALLFALSQASHADARIAVPAVPDGIDVSAENKVFLVGHAIGTQNYVCSKSGTGVKYVLFTPEATLFGDDGKQIITHYFSPNPYEPNPNPALIAEGVIRPTWQAKDTSSVWASAAPSDGGNSSTDARFVALNAVAWLKLKVVGAEAGPTDGDKLALTTFIQRLNTQGGLPPSTGCATLDDVGNQAYVPYTADYFFYEAR